jgi:hypothetical protein
MQFGPCLDQTPLSLREFPGDHIHRVEGEDTHIILVPRMEMGLVMRRSSFGKHSDDNPEKPAEFRHRTILARHPGPAICIAAQ